MTGGDDKHRETPGGGAWHERAPDTPSPHPDTGHPGEGDHSPRPTDGPGGTPDSSGGAKRHADTPPTEDAPRPEDDGHQAQHGNSPSAGDDQDPHAATPRPDGNQRGTPPAPSPETPRPESGHPDAPRTDGDRRHSPPDSNAGAPRAESNWHHSETGADADTSPTENSQHHPVTGPAAGPPEAKSDWHDSATDLDTVAPRTDSDQQPDPDAPRAKIGQHHPATSPDTDTPPAGNDPRHAPEPGTEAPRAENEQHHPATDPHNDAPPADSDRRQAPDLNTEAPQAENEQHHPATNPHNDAPPADSDRRQAPDLNTEAPQAENEQHHPATNPHNDAPPADSDRRQAPDLNTGVPRAESGRQPGAGAPWGGDERHRVPGTTGGSPQAGDGRLPEHGRAQAAWGEAATADLGVVIPEARRRPDWFPDVASPVDEVVLAEPLPPRRVVEPGERSRFTRRRDVVVGLVLVVAFLGMWVVVYRTGEFSRTVHNVGATSGYVAPPQPSVFPPSLGEAWRAASGATWQPVVTGPTVVTGDGGEMVGRDPQTGDVRWSYRRELPLCSVGSIRGTALGLYRTDGNLLPSSEPRSAGGCSELIGLKGSDGSRENQRDSDAETSARLVSDGSYVLTTGRRLVTALRADLVKSMDFGTLPALVNPDRQPHPDCVFESVAMTPGRVGVIERCPEDSSDRLTVYKATAEDGKDSDAAVVITSVLLGSQNARIVGMHDTLTAVAMPDPGRVVVYDGDGGQVSNDEVALGPDDLRRDPEGLTPTTIPATGALYWFTGSRTVVLGTTDLRPLWTIDGTLGPGTVFAGRALVPVPDGIAVISQADGQRVGTIPVDREGYRGVVTMASIGPMVLEQRGPTLVALH